MGKVLGRGVFGEVRECTHLRTNAKRAVKVMEYDAIIPEKK